MNHKAKILLIAFSPIAFLLSHYLVVFSHEYAHSFAAWLLDYKYYPLDIDYGGSSWLNILLLTNINENVNYPLLFTTGYGFYAAIIAFAGPGIANGGLYLLSLRWLKKINGQEQPYCYYFVFMFHIMNLGNLFSYIPIRTFASRGDVAHFIQGLGVSPWFVFIIGGYLVSFLIWHFLTRTMIAAYIDLRLDTSTAKVSLMLVSVGILFAFYAIPGFLGYSEISFFLAATTYIVLPGIILVLWPTREWVILQVSMIKSKVGNDYYSLRK